MSDTQCAKCGGRHEFDAELALARMGRKHEQLASVMNRFMAGVVNTTPPSDPAILRKRTNLVLTLSDELGRIVGGNPTTDFPDCCLIGHRNPNGTISWFCTGVLIHPQVALTAGHCFVPDERANVIALGASDQNELQHAELINLRRLVVHPRYQQTHRISDMTVLILRQPAVTPPAIIATTAELAAAKQTTLVGFGNDDINSTKGFGVKREVKVDFMDLRRTPADDLDSDEQRLGFESDYEFVAGGAGFDTCNGDSGGPAYIQVGAKQKVVGLTSRATDTAIHKCGDGGIYTRIDVHMDFVRQVAADAGIVIP